MDLDYLIRKMEKYADEKGIPIMEKDGINFLSEFVKLNKIKNILEIGSAIGYSAINMALASEDVNIITIERDKDRYIEAVKNIKSAKLDHRITLVLADALDFNTDEKFDLIFIDAAKGKNKDFFEHFEANLSLDGYIITDNMDFHGYVAMKEEDIPSKNILGIVRKIKDYTYFLENHMLYKTTIYKIGDGIAVTERRG